MFSALYPYSKCQVWPMRGCPRSEQGGYIAQNKEWSEGLGGKVRLGRNRGEHATLPGAEGLAIYFCVGGARALMNLLCEKAIAKGAEVIYETWGAKLFTNFSGEV